MKLKLENICGHFQKVAGLIACSAFFFSTVALAANHSISPSGSDVEMTPRSQSTKTLFGYKMKKMESFAADSLVGKNIAALWASNREATKEADENLKMCAANPAQMKEQWCQEMTPLMSFISDAASLPLNEKIALVQKGVNTLVRYRTDQDIYALQWNPKYIENHKQRFALYDQQGAADFYQTYDETAFFQTGDCDDYAIMKYDLLRRLGVPEEKMMLVILGERQIAAAPVDASGHPRQDDPRVSPATAEIVNGRRYEAHALLVVENEDGHKLVLDNVVEKDHKDDLYLDQGMDFIPIYGISGKSQWQSFHDNENDALNLIKSDFGGIPATSELPRSLPHLG